MTEEKLFAALAVVPLVVLAYITWKRMPFIVLRRRVQPVVTVLCIVSWFCHRVLNVTGMPELSLLHLVSHGLELVQEYTVQWAEALDFVPTSVFKWLWLVVQDVVGLVLLQSVWRIIYRCLHYTRQEWQDAIFQGLFDWTEANIPAVKSFIADARAKTKEDMAKTYGKDPNREINSLLPLEGKPTHELLKEMKGKAVVENKKWQKGKLSGTVYANDENHTRFMNDVYAVYSWSNPLHYGVWPSVNQYEAEIISMTSNMLHGSQAIGTTTSGGTESIILAIRAHALHYGKIRGIDKPEVICGTTAHASVDKACDMFKLRQVSIQCDPDTYTLSPRQVEKHITANTVLIYASAPSYPQGVIDPIEELSELAQRYDVGLHVDACLGGFVLPFAKKLGHAIPKFDFECPGVTSMSADTHKYGYSSKGTSVVLYRDEELRRAQYFSFGKWTGGLYATPTIAGSRPGALFACAWAALMSIGESGYKSRVQSILEASAKIAKGVSEIKGLHLLGTQVPTMVVCFASDEMDIYRVSDAMSHRGWELNALQHPACVHICVTLSVVTAVDLFLKELRESVAEVRKEGPSAKKKGSAAIYGTAGSLPAGPVNEIMRCFVDLCLTP